MNTAKDFAAIANIDLTPVKRKLMHAESGEGWSQDQADTIEKEYRRFLYLMMLYPHEQTSPSVEVDTFWHYHILDTRKYAADCEQAFGFFLHHHPYVGMAGEDDDEAVHRSSAERMRELYESTFGDTYPGAAAYCGVTAAKSAYCGVTAAKAAYCGVTATKTAYCGSTAHAAYCGVTATKTAYCGSTAHAAYCGATTTKAAYCGAGTSRHAYCGVTSGKAAYCGVSGKAAYCGVAAGKSAYCGVTAASAECGIAAPARRAGSGAAATAGMAN